MTLEKVADQTNANTDWIPVDQDQLLQYQRPIKKLTVRQGDLGQSIIANGAGEYDTTRESTPRPIIETIPNVVISRLLVISKSEWIHLRFPACGPGFANYGR